MYIQIQMLILGFIFAYLYMYVVSKYRYFMQIVLCVRADIFTPVNIGSFMLYFYSSFVDQLQNIEKQSPFFFFFFFF